MQIPIQFTINVSSQIIMKALEFQSKIKNQDHHISKKNQVGLKDADEKLESGEYKSIDDIAIDVQESIVRGLKDFEEGRIHSNETVRKLYEKYL